ncbi:MAG: Uma2 family endonuclease [Cyanobacteria bacterium SID2]|nr:Uma2 family endonuclease [Cyanobacteria bacterium SID2]MBP0005643.1 Uma2 family endonuclease [Cyanobacteria bacterium SBC]
MVQSSSPVDNSFGFVPQDAIVETQIPVDDFVTAKQKRLLTDSLYTSLRGQSFLVEANVGILHTHGQPLVVPDLILSLDVNETWWQQRHSPYFLWEFGKSPDLVLEIVTDRSGDEVNRKLSTYERLRVSYYVVFDPDKLTSDTSLTVYELRGKCYFEIAKINAEGRSIWLEQVGLGLILWQGDYEEKDNLWLRWCDGENHILPTGFELAKQELLDREEHEKRAERAESQLMQANQRAERTKKWANRLAEQLRTLGVDPDTI